MIDACPPGCRQKQRGDSWAVSCQIEYRFQLLANAVESIGSADQDFAMD